MFNSTRKLFLLWWTQEMFSKISVQSCFPDARKTDSLQLSSLSGVTLASVSSLSWSHVIGSEAHIQWLIAEYKNSFISVQCRTALSSNHSLSTPTLALVCWDRTMSELDFSLCQSPLPLFFSFFKVYFIYYAIIIVPYFSPLYPSRPAFSLLPVIPPSLVHVHG